MTICGAILAGGQSRRFGSDKADAKIGGKRLLDLVAGSLGPQVAELVVCGRAEAEYTSLADRPETGIGPLGGLLAALRYAAKNGHDAVLSTGCDAPDLPGDLGEQLCGNTAAIVESQPVIGYWPTALAATLDAFIADGGRSVYGFAERAAARSVRLKAPLANINRPQDMESYKG